MYIYNYFITIIYIITLFCNWNSLQKRLKSHYEAWSYNKKKKKIKNIEES